ncbi:MAG: zinc ribbon domain-containing protein [Planctomycetota bacterium]
MQFCHECGATLNPKAKFCQRCGKPTLTEPARLHPAMSAEPPLGPQTSPWGYTASLPRPGSGLAVFCTILMILLVALIVVMLVAIIASGPRISGDEEVAIAIVAVVLTLVSLLYAILYLVWLYQTWSAVPPRHRSTTPGAAVGFLFIPFFNIYWMFRAVVGLSYSLERALVGRPQAGPPGAGSGVAIAACVMALIPGPNCLAWLMFIIWINTANAAKNRLIRAELNSRYGPPGL